MWSNETTELWCGWKPTGERVNLGDLGQEPGAHHQNQLHLTRDPRSRVFLPLPHLLVRPALHIAHARTLIDSRPPRIGHGSLLVPSPERGR